MGECVPSADAHERAMALFHEALEMPREEWEDWLYTQTGGDPELQADVLGLLEAHEKMDGVLDRPAAPLGDELIRRVLHEGLGDRYELRGEIGRGGMAVVFLARERKHDRRVALKVLRPEVAQLYGRERFDQEVRLAAQLNHPHILGLIDSGEVDGLLYYVMPYIEGQTLKERIDREGAIGGAEADRLMRQIAGALDYAHGLGVVHRDLKPGNVLWAKNHPYVMDFGVAKTLSPADTGNPDLTAPGMALGTPRYMAPEQALGGVPVDHRADIYAWGLMVYEMLTGRRAPNPGMILDLEEFRRSVEARLDVSPGVVDVVERCLRPNPANRFQSAGAILEALDNRDGHGQPVAAGTGSGRRNGVIAASIAAAAVVAAVAFWPGSAATPGSGLATPVAVAPFANETGEPELNAVGRLAGDWIAQGLQQLGTVPVLPWPASLESAERAEGEAGGIRTDLASYLAEDLGAGTVITGSIYRIGDELQLGAVVTDVRRGRIVSAPEPIQSLDSEVHDAIRQLRDRIMGSLAISNDDRFAARPELSPTPPTFASYRDFDRGVAAFMAQDYSDAADLFHSAWLKDTTFLVSRVYEARSLYNATRRAEADRTLEFLRLREDQLSEYSALEVEFIVAERAGDGVRALEISRQAAALGPNSRASWNEAAMAVQLNRPEEALAVLQRIDPDRGAMRGWAQYWTQLAHANHLLGDFEAEERAAEEMFRRYPQRRVATVLLARARAAAGRPAALQATLEEIRILPPLTYWSFGAAATTAGLELVAHGLPDHGRRVLGEAVEWLNGELDVVPGDRGYRYWLAHALYGLERWADAEAVLRELAADFPERGNYRDFWALSIARSTGSREAAFAVMDSDPDYYRGDHLIYQARLEAVLGGTDRAVSLLSESLERGADDFSWLHARAYHDFLPLRNDPRFVRLMEPHSS